MLIKNASGVFCRCMCIILYKVFFSINIVFPRKILRFVKYNVFREASDCCFIRYYLIIIIMVIFKCYFSGEHISLSINKNNNGVNIALGKNNRLKALCTMQINT